MTSSSIHPFKDSQTYNKANSTYVSYPSQADAMIASLQLFHDVPCRIMDLIFSVITHPDFDATQVTLRDSTDVIDVVEESRLKDRMAVVQERSLGEDGRTVQAGFPQFVLDEVLDIFNADRINRIKSTFNDIHDMQSVNKSEDIYEDWILKEMSLVHRSWTIPSQKALGRVLFINKPAFESRVLLSPTGVRNSIFGPWTTVVAFHLFCAMDEENEYIEYDFSYDSHEEYRQRYENLHRIVVGFTNLRSVWIQSYTSFFTKWGNLTLGKLVRRNVYLKDLTLHTQENKERFILDPLVEFSGNLKHLKTLDIEAARFSDTSQGMLMQGSNLVRLHSLTIKRAFSSLDIDLETLRILSALSKHCLESLHIICYYLPYPNFEDTTAQLFTPAQCVVTFGQLRSLRIDSSYNTKQWLEWIGPYSPRLKVFTLDTGVLLSPDTLSLIPATIWSFKLRFTNSRWWITEEILTGMKSILGIFSSGRFSELKSLSLIAPGRYSEYGLHDKLPKARQQEAENLRGQIREFEQSIKCLCQSAGIECSLDL